MGNSRFLIRNTTPMLKLNDVSFSYGAEAVLSDIRLHVAKGEHVALMGESGCGKSTLLKIIYGVLDAGSGELFWNDGRILGPMYNLLPGGPHVKHLAQDFDLMPFTTVRENVGQYLSVRTPKKRAARTLELLELVQLEAFADTKVRYLSGGQQQRAALARVLAQEPELLLLDEPFGQIDSFLKNGLRRKLFHYFKERGITCVTATHDRNDVLPFADRVLVLRNGKAVA